MIESDTIKLLRECDAGIKMGIESINEVLKYVDDSRLHDALTKCRDDHLGLQAQIQEMLDEFHDNGKEPNSIAKSKIGRASLGKECRSRWSPYH